MNDRGPAGGRSAPRRAAAYFSAVILVAAVIVALVAVARSGEGDTQSAAPAFQPVYTGMEARRLAAGVSTMGDPQDADAHLHPRLVVYANGERVPVPVNIGIDPAKPGSEMASLHTHETGGTIHVEGMAEATLGQFFEIWGVAFSESELGPYRVDGPKAVRMWVDGKPSTAFEELAMEDGQEIVVAYGPESDPPPPEVGE